LLQLIDLFSSVHSEQRTQVW